MKIMKEKERRRIQACKLKMVKNWKRKFGRQLKFFYAGSLGRCFSFQLLIYTIFNVLCLLQTIEMSSEQGKAGGEAAKEQKAGIMAVSFLLLLLKIRN